ncbi:MAG: XdhC family protein [Candidatus Marinimicrobia bacterium]|nr:XdhC family protein [Candidatus Neomarinimicrobiota bacterium]
MEKQFYQTLLEFDFSEPTALCTVMDWKGSVPRKDYPMMLVCQSGIIIGTIGGGTMEKEVIERAMVSLDNNQTSLDSFDFTNDDLSKDGGLCGGTVKVAVEPYTRKIQSFWSGLKETEIGQTWLTTYHFQTNKISRQILNKQIQIDGLQINELIKGKKNKTIISKDAIHLYRHVAPNPILHIFGGGHVGKAVAELAHYIELDITIHDDRESFASMERFPNALSRSFEPIGTMMGNVRIQSSDFALVASRGHHHDLELIRWLLKSSVGWIGLVSSQRKWKILSDGLRKEGHSEENIARVQAPVGVDIQAQTVPEIAVSIIGGIIHYLRNTKEA